jgi:hypothetical protein
LAECRYVAVLGSGGRQLPRDIGALPCYSTSGRSRLTEAVRLMRVLPNAKLIVSGPGDKDRSDLPSHAVVLAPRRDVARHPGGSN